MRAAFPLVPMLCTWGRESSSPYSDGRSGDLIKNSDSWAPVQTPEFRHVGLGFRNTSLRVPRGFVRPKGACILGSASNGASLDTASHGTPGSALVGGLSSLAGEAPVCPLALSIWAIVDLALPILHACVLGKAPAFLAKAHCWWGQRDFYPDPVMVSGQRPSSYKQLDGFREPYSPGVVLSGPPLGARGSCH